MCGPKPRYDHRPKEDGRIPMKDTIKHNRNCWSSTPKVAQYTSGRRCNSEGLLTHNDANALCHHVRHVSGRADTACPGIGDCCDHTRVLHRTLEQTRARCALALAPAGVSFGTIAWRCRSLKLVFLGSSSSSSSSCSDIVLSKKEVCERQA